MFLSQLYSPTNVSQLPLQFKKQQNRHAFFFFLQTLLYSQATRSWNVRPRNTPPRCCDWLALKTARRKTKCILLYFHVLKWQQYYVYCQQCCVAFDKLPYPDPNGKNNEEVNDNHSNVKRFHSETEVGKSFSGQPSWAAAWKHKDIKSIRGSFLSERWTHKQQDFDALTVISIQSAVKIWLSYNYAGHICSALS